MGYDGKKITELRLARGWSGAELARRAKLSQPTLWALEHQVTKKPKNDTLVALANVLGVPLKVLYSTKPTKGNVPSLDELEAVWEGLDVGNKQVLLATAALILKNQKGEK